MMGLITALARLVPGRVTPSQRNLVAAIEFLEQTPDAHPPHPKFGALRSHKKPVEVGRE
jgi:hypothetical protein